MESGKTFRGLAKGFIASIIVAIISLLILSVVMTNFDLNDNIYNIAYYIVTSLGLLIGTIIAVKIVGKRGWLVGVIMGIAFFGVIFIFTAIIKGEFTFNSQEFIKLGIWAIVGTITGMLGVNL